MYVVYVVYVSSVFRHSGSCMLSTLSGLFVVVARVEYAYVIKCVRHTGPCSMPTLAVSFVIVARA